MGDGNPENIRIPIVARGLRVLLVDNDIYSLMYASSVLEQHFYKVRTTGLASEALSIIEEEKEQIDLVIADTGMKETDIVTFSRRILNIKDLPIIFIGYQENNDDMGKAILEAACLFLCKPASPSELVNVWQHVFRRRIFQDVEKLQLENESHLGHREVYPPMMTVNCNPNQCKDDTKRKLEEMLLIRTMEKMNNYEPGRSDRNCEFPIRKSKEQNSTRKGKKNRQRKRIMSRMKWAPELHLKFIEALNKLGEKEARPKAMLEFMNEPSLTVRHVASHLQKYRGRMRCINNVTNNSPITRPNMATDTYNHNSSCKLTAHPWYWPNSMAHTQAFAIGSSVHNNFPNLQGKLFPHNSLQNPSSFLVNNTIGYCSTNINSLSENHQNCLVPSTIQAPGINNFEGIQGASGNPNAEAPHNQLWAKHIVENPRNDFSEFQIY